MNETKQTALTDKQGSVLKLLRLYTGGRPWDLWALAGSQKASVRAHIMSEIAGQRTPQSKAGVTALQVAVHTLFETTGDCVAAREENLREITAETN